jgi:hypothetical protein
MIMSFRITGLPAERFAHLFALSDQELAAQGAVRRTADGRMPGYPCRVSLTDSHEGDELILVNYEHHGVDSPYRMRFAIYVREGDTTYDAIDAVPEQLRTRMLAVRAFDVDAMMTGCELVDGRELEVAIARLFANSKAAYLHVHFAAPGCYAARVERACAGNRKRDTRLSACCCDLAHTHVTSSSPSPVAPARPRPRW